MGVKPRAGAGGGQEVLGLPSNRQPDGAASCPGGLGAVSWLGAAGWRLEGGGCVGVMAAVMELHAL